MKRFVLMVAGVTVALWIGAVPARAEFCIEITEVADPIAFFRFKGSYSYKPAKITRLNGRVTALDPSTGDALDAGPAFGQMFGVFTNALYAANRLGVTFAHGSETVGHLTVTLDDNSYTLGGGRVFLPAGATDVGAQLVDCANEPQVP